MRRSALRTKVSPVHVLNLLPFGPLDYMDVDAIQRKLHDQVARLEAPDTLIAWEPRDTYTAGRRTQPQDIPDSDVPVIKMDRGGSVTYHGPGQLVVYPIVKVKPPKDVVAFVRNTELALGRAMAEFGIHTQQVEGRSGAWILPETESSSDIDRKLCAIGIKFADDATMHGLALNVTTNLDRFFRVVPCGLSDAGVASLESEGVSATLPEVAAVLLPELARTYEQFVLRPSADEAPAPAREDQLPPVSELPELDANEWMEHADEIRSNTQLAAKTGVAWAP